MERIEKGMEDGSRYTHVSSAKKRAAWQVVRDVVPDISEKQGREIINKLLKDKALVSKPYRNPETRKEEEGLWKSVEPEHPF